jgi:hypothetical protein
MCLAQGATDASVAERTRLSRETVVQRACEWANANAIPWPPEMPPWPGRVGLPRIGWELERNGWRVEPDHDRLRVLDNDGNVVAVILPSGDAGDWAARARHRPSPARRKFLRRRGWATS